MFLMFAFESEWRTELFLIDFVKEGVHQIEMGCLRLWEGVVCQNVKSTSVLIWCFLWSKNVERAPEFVGNPPVTVVHRKCLKLVLKLVEGLLSKEIRNEKMLMMSEDNMWMHYLLRKNFRSHCETGTVTLRLRLKDHVAEDVEKLGGLHFLSALLFEQYKF